MAALISQLSNGIKVATLNNGVKNAARVGLYSAHGSSSEGFGDTLFAGKMNLFSNAVNIGNPQVQAKTERDISSLTTTSTSVNKAMDRLGNALFKTDFDGNLAQAKKVAHTQVDALDRNYWDLSKEYAYRTGFQGEPLGEPVTGRDDTINFTTGEELSSRAANIAKDGCVLVAVGDVDHAAVEKQAEQVFGRLRPSQGVAGDHSCQLFTGSFLTHRADSLLQGWCTLIQHAVPATDNDYYALLIASKIIGSWDNTFEYGEQSPINLGRRFTRNPDYCTKFNCFYDTFKNNGVFGITYHVPVDDQRADFCTVRIQNAIANLSRQCTDFMAVRGRNTLMMEAAREMENNACEYIGRGVLVHNAVPDVSHIKMATSNCDAAAIGKAVDTWLFDQEVAAGIVGTVEAFGGPYSMRANTAKMSL